MLSQLIISEANVLSLDDKKTIFTKKKRGVPFSLIVVLLGILLIVYLYKFTNVF